VLVSSIAIAVSIVVDLIVALLVVAILGVYLIVVFILVAMGHCHRPFITTTILTIHNN
jgi:hypothetical protein